METFVLVLVVTAVIILCGAMIVIASSMSALESTGKTSASVSNQTDDTSRKCSARLSR